MRLIYQFCILLIGALVTFSCNKTRIDENQEWQFPDGTKANIKVINGYTAATPAPPTGITAQRFLVLQNGVKMNGIGITVGNIWPTQSAYASAEPGQSNIRLMNDRLVAGILGAPAAGDTVANVTADLGAGKYYSMFLVGPAPAKELVIVEDNLSGAIDTGSYRIRVANMTTDPARPIRVYSRRYQKDLVTGVNYKQVTDFITLPMQYSGLTDTLDLFTVGNATRIASFNTFSPTRQFTYTFYTHGKTGFRTEVMANYTNK